MRQNNKNIKVVILAGGFGSRISEYTKKIPKPMIKINNKPIIEHIIEYYYKFGFEDFILATGYKSNVIKDYFKGKKKYKIQTIFTGLSTMTGGRLKRLSKYLDDTFLLTYGDGLCNVDLNKLLKYHKANNKIVTVTAVRPPARFGVMNIKKGKVVYFKEKVQMSEGWINGGFFVMEPQFLKLIRNDQSILEQKPLEEASKQGSFFAYKHHGFWQCMDTKRDKDHLEKIIKKKIFV